LLITTVTFVSAKSEVGVVKSAIKDATASGRQLGSSVGKLEELESKIKNPQAKEALQMAAQTTEQVEATAESALNEMYGRPGFLKFIIGPDYKNAGEVRSEIVRLRNEIRQLTRVGEGLSGSDKTAIDQSIAALQEDLTTIETKLSDALEGVSLFGWLSKILTGFATPTTLATPTPSASATPVSTASPIPTASPEAE